MNILEADTGLNYLFLDLNSYFASVEQQDNPALRGKPIAVVPMDSDGTCAIAASYEAKAFGVKTGTKIFDAKRMCPGLICVPARHGLYRKYHDLVLEEFVKHTPIRKVWSIDECDSRLMLRHRTKEAAIDLAKQIKKGIAQNVGGHIKASIGIAPNSFLAKVATDMQKPDGLVVLEAHDMAGKLFQLELRDLPGIGPNMEIRLRKAGIGSIEDLWHCPPKHARRIWGGVGGERFWYNLHGVQVPESVTERGVIGHSRVLDPELREPHHAYQIARRLTAKAMQRMRREEFLATQFTLYVKSAEGHWRWSADYKMNQTDEVTDALAALQKLWFPHVGRNLPGRLLQVGINLHGLVPKDKATGDLFDFAKTSPKRRHIDAAMEEVNKRFGPQTVNLGMIPVLSGAPIGTKIAFSRVPDQAEFLE